MKQVVMVLIGTILTLAATAASSQTIQPDGSDNLTTGTMQYVSPEEGLIVVDDQSYALRKAVWIDGTRHRVDEVKPLLERNETVELELSSDTLNGYRLVTHIHTNP